MLRAVQSLGIDAHLNDRNDICVGLEKMSIPFLISLLCLCKLCVRNLLISVSPLFTFQDLLIKLSISMLTTTEPCF